MMAATLILASARASDATDEPRLADYFGFLPTEVYKLDPRITGLIVRDLDGDKVDDVAVVNNGRSRIDLLLSSKKPSDAAEPEAKKTSQEPNHLENDRRMRLVSVSVTKEIQSLAVGDFNGDGKADLAFYGTPAELVILHGEGKGKFDDPKKINTGEAVEAPGALTVGDLNGDGRDDLALLTSGEVITILQGEGGKLGEPERIPHTLTNPRMVKAVDFDGNGSLDLVLLEGSPDDPIRVRFSTKGGALGPEQRFAIEPLRAYAFGQIDGKPGSELLTIEQQSGRVRVHALDVVDDDDTAKRGRLLFYPLPHGNTRGRSLDLGDLDGDGLTDVVVSDPANAQFYVYRQAKGVGLGASQGFPNLVGGRTVKLADLDGDKRAEVYVLSEQEKQIGRSVLADDRLTFPAPLPLSGEPVALEIADLDGDKVGEILYVTREQSAKSTADQFTLRALKREKSGGFVPFRWGQADSVSLHGLSDAPIVQVLDVNRDGQPDILLYSPSGPKSLLLGRQGEPPRRPPAASGRLPTSAPPASARSISTAPRSCSRRRPTPATSCSTRTATGSSGTSTTPAATARASSAWPRSTPTATASRSSRSSIGRRSRCSTWPSATASTARAGCSRSARSTSRRCTSPTSTATAATTCYWPGPSGSAWSSRAARASGSSSSTATRPPASRPGSPT